MTIRDQVRGRTEVGMVYDLVCHPESPITNVTGVAVQVLRDRQGVSLIFMVEGNLAVLRVPPAAKPYRADGLWQTTCFELFVRHDGEGYVEFNFSPSHEWAAYVFTSYRSEMRALAIEELSLLSTPPAIWTEDEADGLSCFALGTCVGRIVGEPLIALSAVIEETDGTKSYWALAHAPGPPDFHNPACFTATLPPPDRP